MCRFSTGMEDVILEVATMLWTTGSGVPCSGVYVVEDGRELYLRFRILVGVTSLDARLALIAR